MQAIKNIYHFVLSWAGNIFYRNPSKELVVIGITGTKGKSTTLEILNSILEGVHKKTALLSSVWIKVGDERERNRTETTMPGRFFIQRFLRRAANEGCEYALLEVTSQGIPQHRHRNIEWDVAGFLNLHPEHIESHGSFKKYREAKLDFFRYVHEHSSKKKVFVINKEDKSASHFKSAADGEKTIEFTRDTFVEEFLKGDISKINSWLQSKINLENAAFSASIAKALGIKEDDILNALKEFDSFSGRMEWIQKKPFGVLIDYAHTPDSLRAIYEEIALNKDIKGKLICVLGSCGGGRDKWKRPEFGRLVEEYCDKAILTNEDPHDEDPQAITEAIAEGINTKPYKTILDRREAIEEAIASAKQGDVVVITGKGNEEWIKVRGKRIPWSDRTTAEKALRGIDI